MTIEIKINCPNPDKDLHIPYLTWSPTICYIRILGNKGSKNLFLKTNNLGKGRVVFTDARRGQLQREKVLNCIDENWTSFYLTGDYGHASTRDKDVEIYVYQEDPTMFPTIEPIYIQSLMVRVRKDAETLTVEERDRFLLAFSKLNQKEDFEFYKQFTDMHISSTDMEIHHFENFLPWHRLYLLNLERDLQAIDPSVSLHYWRWDFPSPNLFSEDFAGKMTITNVEISGGEVPKFSKTNPLINWQPPSSAQLLRSAFFWDLRENGGWSVLVDRKAPEAYAISMGDGEYSNLFWSDDRLRGRAKGLVFSKPHGGGHLSFRGQVAVIETAPQDPVFFMLHANVDRIWALWQNHWDRFDPQNATSYSPQGLSPNRDYGFGAYSKETQWPWNGDKTNPRPEQAPYGEFPTVNKGYQVLPLPTSTPNIEEVIDYKGRLNPANSIGFDYDNVPFHFTPPPEPTHLLESMDNQIYLDQILDQNLDIELRLTALSSIGVDTENIEELLPIVFNKQEDARIRGGVLRILTSRIGYKEVFLDALFNILSDLNEPVELRRIAILQIRALAFDGLVFLKFRSVVLEFLRTLVNDKDKQIAKEAIDLLAYQRDEFVQRLLVEGLANSDETIVSAELAVFYLSLDSHNFLDIFRKVAEESTDEKAKIMAIRALSSNTNSSEFLYNLLEDKNQTSQVREAAAHALNVQNPNKFLTKSIKILKDGEEEDHQLLTVLLSKLTLQEEEGLKQIRQDEELLFKIGSYATQSRSLKANTDSSNVGDNDFEILLRRLTNLIDELPK